MTPDVSWRELKTHYPDRSEALVKALVYGGRGIKTLEDRQQPRLQRATRGWQGGRGGHGAD